MKGNLHEIIYTILKCSKNKYLSRELIYEECVKHLKEKNNEMVFDEDFQKYFLLHIMTIQSKFKNIEFEDDLDGNIESLVFVCDDDDDETIDTEISDYLRDDNLEQEFEELSQTEELSETESIETENISEVSINYELNFYSKYDLVEYLVENQENSEIQDLLEYKDQYNNNFMHLLFQLNNKELLSMFLNKKNQHLLIEKNNDNKTPIDMMSNKMLKTVLTSHIEKINDLENRLNMMERNQIQSNHFNAFNNFNLQFKMNLLNTVFFVYIIKELLISKFY